MVEHEVIYSCRTWRRQEGRIRNLEKAKAKNDRKRKKKKLREKKS